MMGAQHMLDLDSKCALSMGQRSKYAAVAAAQIKLKKKDYASNMGQRSNFAAMKSARIKQKEEESVGHTAGSHPNVLAPDAKITPSEKEYAGRMGRKICSKSAKMKDAQT
jgi:hypothetical protein